MEKEKKKLKKWIDLDIDLRFYFLFRWVVCGIVAVILLICMFTSDLYSTFLTTLLLLAFYTAYFSYSFLKVLQDKLLVIYGECEVLNTDNDKHLHIAGKNRITFYGKSNITVKCGDKKVVVPVSSQTPIAVGNTVKIFTFEESIFQEGENFYTVTTPLLVKLARK